MGNDAVDQARAAAVMMQISDQEFAALRSLIYSRFGINLTEEKRSLLVGRLQKLLRSQNLASFQDYYDYLAKDTSGRAVSDLVNLISTNYTYFNREKDHFDYFLKTALPQVCNRLRQRGQKDVRVWCAGCSSGEEAYTLLMLMHEYLGAEYRQWSAGLLATDISERVLATARQGIYAADKVASLPEALQRKYFVQLGDGRMQVAEALRQEVTFRRFNLMNTSFPFKKPFQIIFCRNVMIYFDQQTRNALVQRFHRAMEPDGYFFIGHSETLGRDSALFRYIMPAVYQKGN
ncbi:MAG: protein-glutamate O-methyltransferase CheR [Desulfuromonas thiophila]|uniref:CheR family methyltransferase n=1 Tax=Desulfuromonas thiophila TaxID=57664 RepID=UPI0024A8F01C|nr:protein-glutamate O-methyltransferase CheR [Desulfuromonas thiophila]MDD3801159.1 protein-glutamate O-methyltransferase CheR [Desulfuromonas thiophila]